MSGAPARVSPAAGYAEARSRFRTAAAEAGARLTEFVHPDQRGPDGGELAIDVAELGPPDAASVLLVVSGTHGVEGYAGSALQTGWLEQQGGSRSAGSQPGSQPDGLRVVLLHGFNPFGFAWNRRTNEDNVDLNRNFIDWTAPPPHNPDYDQLAELLVPARWNEASRAESTARLLEIAATVGAEEMQRAITGGQYRYPQGVFFGGSEPVWSHRWLVANAQPLLGTARRLGIIDIHTGLGPWGHGELIAHVSSADAGYDRARRWWGEVRSMTDGESVSAELTGDWLGRIEGFLPGIEITAAALEFGTIDGVAVLQALRAEAFFHGTETPHSPEAVAARAAVRAAFVDEDPKWMAALGRRFDQVIGAAIDQLVV